MARTAVLTATILAAISFPLGNVARTGALQAPTSEQAPQVKPAIDGVLDLFKQKQVVALGDFHGVAQEEAFYSALVRDPRFAEQVGNVVVEFGGSAAQGIIDRYVNGEDVPFTELRHVWTDVVGWLPGPFLLGFINFYATVRAVNANLPPDHRIKVWLGDPKIDWTKINSAEDLQPFLARRDDNIAGIIVDEILKKQKKTLLIIGSAHLAANGSGPGAILPPLVAKIVATGPNALAEVAPFTGYADPECNAKFGARAKDWPVPAIARPIEGTWLKSELQLAGCNYVLPEQVKRMKEQLDGMLATRGLLPLTTPFATMMANQNLSRSGVNFDAVLYLGPPDTLTESPIEPSFYLDPDYFKEMNRRAQCCMGNSYTLDWDHILQQNSAVPRKFQPR